MKPKKVCYTELAYVVGILALAMGAALMERADFGMSMVVAPAYLLHLKLSQYFPAYSFGMSEYVLQAVLIVVMSIALGKFKKGYLFSFVTAVIYGFTLDLFLSAAGYLPNDTIPLRLAWYTAGILLCAVGVSFFFRTYLPSVAYELFVQELSERRGLSVSKVKTIYDCCSCITAIALSFLFFGFGHFEGVKAGTIVCALLNGWLIGRICGLLDSLFEFRDAFSWRVRFQA